MEELIESLILIGIEALSCDLFFRTFMKRRYEKINSVHGTILILLTLLLLAVDINTPNQLAVRMIGVTMSIILFMRILYIGKAIQIVFFSICYYSILCVIDTGAAIILYCLGNGSMEYIIKNSTDEMILSVLVRAVCFTCIVLINRIFSKKISYGQLSSNEWIRFMFFPIFTIATMCFMLFSEGMDKKVGLFMSIGLLMSDILLFGVINDFTSRTEENQKVSLIQERWKNQIETYESMELSYNQQKKKVHEFKNHLDCIQGLLLENREQEALTYISKINNLAEQHMNYFNTLNPVADVVINQKYQQAQEEGITMIAVLDELNKIPMNDKDLVILLSNLLNNAIEACKKLEAEKRMIKFKFTQNSEQIIISVRNPIEEQVAISNNRVKTTKVNKREHGIGLYNIEEVVGKYGGDGICTSTQNEFSYTIIFDKEQMYSVY